jgi:hypothetical protein
MTSLYRDERLIRNTARRGVDIDIIKVDPSWLRETPGVAAELDDYYDQDASFVERIEYAHARLIEIAESVNSEGAGRVTIRTYRASLHYSGSVRDPGTSNAAGYVEFHLYRRTVERLGVGMRNYVEDDFNSPILLHVLDSLNTAVERAAAYRTREHGATTEEGDRTADEPRAGGEK